MGQLKNIMDPMLIFKLEDTEIDRLAGETEKSRAAREELQAKLRALQNGSDTCKKLAAPFIRGTFNALDLIEVSIADV